MTGILSFRVARTGWEEGAASYAHKMSKAPKPDAGKHSGPVKTNEVDFSSHSFSGNQLKVQVNPEDGFGSTWVMDTTHSIGFGSNIKEEASR